MSTNIEAAFEAMSRQNFLPEEVVHLAEYDEALPIGYGQTNSQPYTVRKMLEWLQVKPGNKILDVGSGSGWTTALLAHLTGKEGKVTAVEIVPELVEMGRENCAYMNVKNVKFHQAGKKFGWPKGGPYDRILVSASKRAVPPELFDQLKTGGKMVIPNLTSILEIDKEENGDIDTFEHPGFRFVPLVQSASST